MLGLDPVNQAQMLNTKHDVHFVHTVRRTRGHFRQLAILRQAAVQKQLAVVQLILWHPLLLVSYRCLLYEARKRHHFEQLQIYIAVR